ncbi:MAG: M64 family metallopeptidase [Pseudomonadota bacterium]|nr:M64 family metallopeptidase [Pseudomonadota bacterium]
MANGPGQVLRLEVEYGPSHATIVSSELVDGAPLSADAAPEDDSDGVWISVTDLRGATAFNRILPQPDRPVEVFAEDGSITRGSGTTGPTRAVVDVPWTGEDGDITLKSGRPGPAMAIDGGAVSLLSLSMGEARDIGPPVEDLTLDPGLPVMDLDFGLPHEKAMRLVFLPDGFTTGELPLFHEVVHEFLATLSQTPPFLDFPSSLSACRVDLASPTSGVIDPIAPGNGAKPVFGATMGKGALRRVIVVDQQDARTAAKRAVGDHRHFIGIVVANTTEYGGSGGDVAVFSRHAGATHIAIHELGHSLFGLADEYSDAGQSSTDKPIEPNVAGKPYPHALTWASGESNQLKWASFLTAGVAFPTPPAVSNPATVGAYEGAKYTTTGIFRPSPICKMRNISDDFCRVCQDQISIKLRSHQP